MGWGEQPERKKCPDGHICEEVGCLGPSLDPNITINLKPNSVFLRCNIPTEEVRKIGSVPAAEVLRNPAKFIRRGNI